MWDLRQPPYQKWSGCGGRGEGDRAQAHRLSVAGELPEEAASARGPPGGLTVGASVLTAQAPGEVLHPLPGQGSPLGPEGCLIFTPLWCLHQLRRRCLPRYHGLPSPPLSRSAPCSPAALVAAVPGRRQAEVWFQSLGTGGLLLPMSITGQALPLRSPSSEGNSHSQMSCWPCGNGPEPHPGVLSSFAGSGRTTDGASSWARLMLQLENLTALSP